MAYLEDFEQLLKDRCYQNEIPGCSAACPFNLDVLDLQKKWQKGRFNAAHRTFHNAVGFPAIVAAACDHPCMKKCIRGAIDAPVDLHLLEQATEKYAKRKDPNSYNLPARPERAAVVGGGISGLGCALFLCNKKYQVTVFEKSDHLGGALREEMDPAVFDEDVALQFKYEKYELVLNHEVRDLAELEGFDAVYVATGAGGNDFGLQPGGEGAFASTRKGVFFGGRMTSRTHMEALADGLLASHALERYFKTGLMNQPEEHRGTKLKIDPSRHERKEKTGPADGASFTEEEAVAEAERCIRCSCDACMRSCDLMRYFDKTPRRVYEEVYVTIRPGTLSRDGTMATRLISTCNQCGVCREVCPEHIDFGKFFADSMKAMQAKGTMPWPYHDYWMRDMDFSNGEAAVFLQNSEKVKYLFFPGCQMGASDPLYVEKLWAWLAEKQPESALWVHCCGAPAEWAGLVDLHADVVAGIRQRWKDLGQPEVLLACPTCRQMFARFLPEIPCGFIFEMMEEWGLEDVPQEARTFSLFDACAARDFGAYRGSIRRLLAAKGISAKDIPSEDGALACCSFGGHAAIAAAKYSKKVAQKRADSAEGPMLTYCVNCRDSFAGQGKEAWHVADLLFGIRKEARPAPTVTERWENRIRLKDSLQQRYLGIIPPERTKMKLWMTEETRQRMSEDLILESDVEQVIAHCETDDAKLEDPETGHYFGHLKIKNMTYWAEYLPKEDGYELFSAYCHRMCLEAEDEKNG